MSNANPPAGQPSHAGPPPPGARVGQEAAGRYRLLRPLGSGGMGEVYEAEHIAVGKRVAIKCLWPGLGNDPEQVQRFEREARVASIVQSPYVVDVIDAGRLEDGAPFLVMELLHGTTLAAELTAQRTLPIDRVVAIARQLATGLAAAHAAGIVHRDLKPENVFLQARDGGQVVKILDFGVSKFRREDHSVELTRTGAAIGTPAYMAPEQVEGLRDVDARADVWSLGVMLFRMLVGELPFVADSYARMLVRIIADDPAPRVRSRRPDVPRDLDAIVARCLEKSPAGRYLSMADLLAALPRSALPGIDGRADLARPADRAPEPPQELTDSSTRRSARPGPDVHAPPGAATVLARPGSGGTPPLRASPEPAHVTPAPRASPVRPVPPLAPALRSDSTPLGSSVTPGTRAAPGTPPPSPARPSADMSSAPVRGTSVPFDEVILTEGAQQRRLPAHEFFALPLSVRIQHVIARTVTFLLNGREVDRGEALARMRERFVK